MNTQLTLEQIMSGVLALNEGISDRFGANVAGIKAQFEPSEENTPRMEKTRNARFIHLINGFINKLAKYQTAFRDLAADNWENMPADARNGAAIEDHRLGAYLSGLSRAEKYATNAKLAGQPIGVEYATASEMIVNPGENTTEKQSRYEASIGGWAREHADELNPPTPAAVPAETTPEPEKDPEGPWRYGQLDGEIQRAMSSIAPDQSLPLDMYLAKTTYSKDHKIFRITLEYMGNKAKSSEQLAKLKKYYRELKSFVESQSNAKTRIDRTPGLDSKIFAEFSIEDPSNRSPKTPDGPIATKEFGDEIVRVAKLLHDAVVKTNKLGLLPTETPDTQKESTIELSELSNKVARLFGTVTLPDGLEFTGLKQESRAVSLTFSYTKTKMATSSKRLEKYLNVVIKQTVSDITSVFKNEMTESSSPFITSNYSALPNTKRIDTFKSYMSTVTLTEGTTLTIKLAEFKPSDTDGKQTRFAIAVYPRSKKSKIAQQEGEVSEHYAVEILRTSKYLIDHIVDAKNIEVLQPVDESIVSEHDNPGVVGDKLDAALHTAMLKDKWRFYPKVPGSNGKESVEIGQTHVSFRLYLEVRDMGDIALKRYMKEPTEAFNTVLQDVISENPTLFKNAHPTMSLEKKLPKQTRDGSVKFYVPAVITIPTAKAAKNKDGLRLTKDAANKLNAVVSGLLRGMSA